MKKLILFGDSLFGRFGKDRILILESKLNDYDVYNCAAGGWNSHDCVKKAPYISKLKPDVLVLSVGTNDAAPWKEVDIKDFAENLPIIFNSFSAAKIIFLLQPPVNEDKTPDKFNSLTKSISKKYHDSAKQICEEHNIAFIDSWDLFMPLQEQKIDYHDEDGVHLNDLAYDMISTEIDRLLES